MAYVWAYSRQRKSALLLMLALADFANDEGMAWPSIDSLAAKARCSRRSVIDLLQHCGAEGEIEVQEGASRYATNVYRLCRHDEARGAISAPLSAPVAEGAEAPPDVGVQISPGVQVSGALLHPIRQESVVESISEEIQQQDLVLDGLGAISAPLIAPLTRLGLSEDSARELLEKHGDMLCVQWAQAALQGLRAGQVTNPVGYMRRALSEGWSLPRWYVPDHEHPVLRRAYVEGQYSEFVER